MADITEHLRPEERERWIHAKNLIENSKVGRKIEDSWTEDDVFSALMGQPDHEIAVLWAWRVKRFLERLSACRALMEKHQWGDWSVIDDEEICCECQNTEGDGHASNCAWAQAIEKGE